MSKSISCLIAVLYLMLWKPIWSLSSTKLQGRNFRFVAISSITSSTNIPKTGVQLAKTTGAFKAKLPDLFIGSTHYKRGLRSLKVVKVDDGIKNSKNRYRKFTAQSFDALHKGLSVPITEVLNAYTKLLKSLHPFEVRWTTSIRSVKLLVFH